MSGGTGDVRRLARRATATFALAWVGAAHAQSAPPRAAGDVAVDGRGYAFTASRLHDDVYALREEVTAPELVRALGGRSAVAELTVNCREHQSTIAGVRVFPDAGGAGASTPVAPGAWMKTAPVDLLDLTAPICAAAPPPQAGAARAASPTPAAPPTTRPDAASEAEPRPRTAAAAPAAPAADARWIQLGAFASAALAEAQWTRLRGAEGLAPPGRRVEPVRRGEAELFRLLAGPYPTLAAAQSACAAARRTGAACIVR